MLAYMNIWGVAKSLIIRLLDWGLHYVTACLPIAPDPNAANYWGEHREEMRA